MSTTTSVSTSLPHRRGLTEQAADAAVEQACRMLRLPTIRTNFTELADEAATRIIFRKPAKESEQ